MRLYRARADQRHLCILSFLVKHPSHSCPVIPSLSYCPPAEPSLFRWFSFSQSSFTSFFFISLCFPHIFHAVFVYIPSCQHSAFKTLLFLIILKSPLPTSLPILAVASPFLCFACSIVAGLSHLVSSLTPAFPFTHHHGWGSQASKAHRSQSVYLLLCLGPENRRGRGILPPHRRVSCHRENQKRRW